MAVVSATTTENKQAPPDDPGWNNVGRVNGSTGVYIGHQLVITAAHVGAEEITFPSAGTFQFDPDSVVRLTTPVADPEGDTTKNVNADLVVFRLTELPDLPALQIATEMPRVGTEVLMIGHGHDRASEPTYWNVTQQGSENVWEELATPEDAENTGFKTLNDKSLSWGTNVVENDEPFYFEFDSDRTTTVFFGGNTTTAFVTEFDDPEASRNSTQPSTTFESQAVLHDSGGAVFHKKDDQWELAGIITNVDSFAVDQPNLTRNPIFGNVTLSANLASYRDQILSNIVYQTGDFDQDGVLGAGDIDLLSLLIREGNATVADHDLDGDGVVNGDDRFFWVEEIANTHLGDSNLDGEFNSTDLVAVFTTQEYEDDIVGNSTWRTGDWNGDGEFDSSDMVRALQGNGYENGPRRPFQVPAAVVPEPASVVLLCLALAAGLFRYRR